MKLLFINHSEEKCGVYQHGKRLAEIFSKDPRYTLVYREIDSSEQLINLCRSESPEFIFYNWNLYTITWLTPEIVSTIKSEFQSKQMLFQHEGGNPRSFPVDAIVMADMSEDENSKIFSLPRALFEVEFKKPLKNDKITIGSFGFGFDHKGFDRVCLKVQREFEEAVINLHLTAAFYGDGSGAIRDSMIAKCNQMIYSPKVELNITTNFISDEELLNFLHGNDINLFMYDAMPGRTGISSVIDYAISAEKPFGVTHSSMFRHVLAERPSINVEDNSISSIIDGGNEPSLHFKNIWSNQVLRDKLYYIMEKI